jgi:uncharacterized protein YjbI with pentapeptide repeats
VVSILWQKSISADQARQATRLENLRFVRQIAISNEPGRPFSEIDLQGQNLTGLHLEGAQFDDANLQYANFSWSHFEPKPGVGEFGPELTESSFTRAHMRRAILYFANLRGAWLDRADLRNAYLVDAHLEGAHLQGANLDGAVLYDVYYDQYTSWPEGFTPPPRNPGPTMNW